MAFAVRVIGLWRSRLGLLVIQNEQTNNPIQNEQTNNPIQNEQTNNPIQNEQTNNPIQNEQHQNPNCNIAPPDQKGAPCVIGDTEGSLAAARFKVAMPP
jgi:hypothetical protein